MQDRPAKPALKPLKWIGSSKSKKGIETPKHDIELIKARLKTASDDYEKQQTSRKP